jgi:hypothetical protein
MSSTEKLGPMTREEFLAEVKPIPENPPFAPDWEITSVERTGDKTYPYLTCGINHNRPEGQPGRKFQWRVPDLHWRYFWPGVKKAESVFLPEELWVVKDPNEHFGYRAFHWFMNADIHAKAIGKEPVRYIPADLPTFVRSLSDQQKQELLKLL